MKITKIIFLLFLFILAFFALYIFKYQLLVNDGSELADERCLKLEPLLAHKQQKAFEYYQAAQSLEEDIVLIKKIEELKKYYKSTVELSEPWMKKQKAFLNRWDFKFFTHPVLKEVFYAQYDKYVADLESNKAMYKAIDQPNVQPDLKVLTASLTRMIKTQKILDEKVNKAKKRSDFRYYFIKTPSSTCSEAPLEKPPYLINPNKPVG